MRPRDAVTFALTRGEAEIAAAMLDLAADVVEAIPIRTVAATRTVDAWAHARDARNLANRLRRALPPRGPYPYTTARDARSPTEEPPA